MYIHSFIFTTSHKKALLKATKKELKYYKCSRVWVWVYGNRQSYACLWLPRFSGNWAWLQQLQKQNIPNALGNERDAPNNCFLGFCKKETVLQTHDLAMPIISSRWLSLLISSMISPRQTLPFARSESVSKRLPDNLGRGLTILKPRYKPDFAKFVRILRSFIYKVSSASSH